MRRLSSPLTHYHKRIFPVIFGGLVGTMVFVVSWKMISLHAFVALPIGVFVGAMARLLACGFTSVYVDEVIDEGHRIVVRDLGLEESIDLADIREAVSDIYSPAGIWLHLRRNSIFGSSIKFLPESSLFGFSKMAKSLNARIHEASH
jgi:hypothetical protein